MPSHATAHLPAARPDPARPVGGRLRLHTCAVRLACAALLGLGVGVGPALVQPASAQSTDAATRQYDIAPGPLAAVLTRFADTSGVLLAGTAELTAGAQSPGLQGRYTAQQGLARILAGTGLEAVAQANGSQALRRQTGPNSGAVAQLTPIAVTGARQDLARSEGSGNYAAQAVSIGKTSQALREIPQSVSVITRQQLDDLNITSVNQAMEITNGATVVKNDDTNERSEIYFRGFPVDSLKVDGVSISGNNDVTTFDTAIYDRIEVLRGPAGILHGAGEPGGTINLVRKRPTEQFQATGALGLGSWNRRRAEVDVGGPVNEAGSLRGRFVAVREQADSFIDLVDAEHTTAYGIAEMDLGDRTTLSVGGTWQEGESSNARGLPAYADGRLLNVPRSTYIGADWNHSETRSADVFAALEHRLDNGVSLHVRANHLDRERDGMMAYATRAVDPRTDNTALVPERRIDGERNTNLDAYLNLPVQVGGLTQTFTVGADYQTRTERMDRARAANIVQNVFNPNHHVAEPALAFDRWEEVESEQYGMYAQAQLRPVSWGTVVLGSRLSWWNTQSGNRRTGEQTSTARIDNEFTPYAGLVIDLNPNLSAYASYASIFAPQTETTRELQPLKPREGRQYELGLKGDSADGRLNGRVAVFRINDENRALSDPIDEDYSVAAGKVRSQGFEAELVGALTSNWQVMAGYTYTDTEYAGNADNAGAVFEPRTPTHAARLWTKYDFSDGLRGLSLAGGVSMFGAIANVEDDVSFRRGGYTTVDLQLGYAFNRNLRGTITVTNLFDRKYYQSVSYEERQNYYGSPRAVMLRLASSW
jgi:outer membrane receptor for ferric coprogen and ferric-rhodotorulic acid